MPTLLAENHGLLPTRGSLMLDVVFLALLLVVPLMCWSIYLVRYRRRYVLHKRIQLALGIALLAAITAFEIDLRFITDWEALAVGSPYFVPGTWDAVWISLAIHLCFAVPTPFLWVFVIVRALRRFPHPPSPGQHSAQHIFWARIAAAGLLATAVTGWVFYYLAFIA